MNSPYINESSDTMEAEEQEDSEDQNIIKNHENITQKNDDSYVISIKLIKKFNEMHKGDSDDIIIDYIKTEGLPMKFNNINELSLYLYFNKICSSFYSIFSLIYTKKINDIILSFLQKNYYVLADKEIIHYNFILTFLYQNQKKKIYLLYFRILQILILLIITIKSL